MTSEIELARHRPEGAYFPTLYHSTDDAVQVGKLIPLWVNPWKVRVPLGGDRRVGLVRHHEAAHDRQVPENLDISQMGGVVLAKDLFHVPKSSAFINASI